MKSFITFIIIFNMNIAYSFDVNEYVQKAKSKLNEVLGKKEAPKPIEQKIKMPEIPEVKKDAKSTDVYEKNGKLHTQGNSFNKLSVEDKRKYRVAFIQELYFVVNVAEADKDQIISLLNVLEKGGSREGIYRSLVLSQDYLSLETFREVPSEKVINFAYDMGVKYLRRGFNKESMGKLNVYGIKKVITEKFLELMDAFPSDGKDLRSWYALLSAELGQNHNKLWASKIRKSNNSEAHFKWSGTVPFQHIKSEVIVKLHKVFNSLQK